MEKIKIEVPGGIRFLSDWEDFKLANFPNKCIINKQIPGCGFTEYCICGPENVILCSPRKLLLKNKWDQHENDVYLIVNEMDKDPSVDKDISKIQKGKSNNEKQEEISYEDKRAEIYKRLYEEIEMYRNKRVITGRPMKILVTYDSYHIAVDILKKLNVYHLFYTVVDEFQSILHDARFKSDTEMGFMNNLRQSPTALFVSATPMMDEYLEMLSEFNTLSYYELDWYSQDPTRIVKPDLDVKLMTSIGSKAEEIVNKYLQGNFEEVVVMRNGAPVKIVSTEAVIYVNSVNHIISIIKKCGIKPDQVNILCSDTEENRNRIRKKLGKDYCIGKVPKKGEPHKMFTFCTRTVYLGADFYSLCAQTFILSDANSDCLAVDISEDLPQILGRQRLFENPWKNQATFYYRSTADYRKMTAEDFQNIINAKRKKTESLLRTFSGALDIDKQDLADKYKEGTESNHYKNDYVAVNKIRDEYGNIILVPTTNELVMVNELRAFKIQQIDYKDRFTVFTTIHEKLTKDDIINKEVSNFMRIYDSYKTRYDKLRCLCEYGLSNEAIEIVLSQISDSDEIKSYYLTLGSQKLYSLGYNITRIKKALGIVVFSDELLIDSIYSDFKEGSKLSLVDIKSRLSNLYQSINYKSVPKATDIEKWFNVKECLIPVVDVDRKKKRVRGYELLKSKEQEHRDNLKYGN